LQQEDWLIRQINQLGQVLGKILSDLLGLKAQGKIGAGIEAAIQTLKSEADLNIDDLTSIPTELFIKTLQEDKKLSDDNLETLADIFVLIAEELARRDTDNEMKNKLYKMSLTIYEYLDKTGSTYSFDRHNKIENIKNAL
jgi:hypothetical protein